MTWRRWLPTFLAFPLGGELAIATVGSLDDLVSAAAGGLLAGAVIGTGQWLALRSRGIGRRWIGASAAAMAAGTALAAAVTGAGTELADLMLTGLIAGTAVGAAQSTLLGCDRRLSIAWTAVSAAGWSLAWLPTWAIVDVERGYYVFGASGSVLVTVFTGMALRRMTAAETAVPNITPLPASAA